MTTPPKNAKTAAMEALIEAHAIDLKLPTAAAGSARSPPRPPASSRHRSPISPRCWKPRRQGVRRDGSHYDA